MKKIMGSHSGWQRKSDGVLGAVEMKKTHNKVIYWILFSIMTMIILICVLPPVWILFSSFKTTKELMQIPPKLFPEVWDFSKFARIWGARDFDRYYVNTLAVAGGSVVFSVMCNGMAGYVLSCLKPKGYALYSSLILWTMLLPNTLSMVALFMNMVDFPVLHINLINTYLPMWFSAGANAFMILLYKDFFDGISKSLLDAAKVDGCNRIKIFFGIVLPLSKPIVAVDAIFTVSAAWGDFLLPYLILPEDKSQTVMVALFNMKKSGKFSMDEIMVGIVFAMIPPIIIFFFLQKYIMGGLTIGGVKE